MKPYIQPFLFTAILLLLAVSPTYAQQLTKDNIVSDVNKIDVLIEASYDTIDAFGKRTSPDYDRLGAIINDNKIKIEGVIDLLKNDSGDADLNRQILIKDYYEGVEIYIKSLIDLVEGKDIKRFTYRSDNSLKFGQMQLSKEHLLEYLFEKDEIDHTAQNIINYYISNCAGGKGEQDGFYGTATLGYFNSSIQSELGKLGGALPSFSHLAYRFNIESQISEYFMAGISFSNVPETGVDRSLKNGSFTQRINGLSLGLHGSCLFNFGQFELKPSLGIYATYFTVHTSVTSQTTDSSITNIYNKFDTIPVYIDTMRYNITSTQSFTSHPATIGGSVAVRASYYLDSHKRFAICLEAYGGWSSNITIPGINYAGNNSLPAQSLKFQSYGIMAGMEFRF